MDAVPPPPPAAVRPAAGTPDFLRQINWTPATTAAAPLVAVLDTGVDPTAQGLSRAVERSLARSFVPSSPRATEDTEGHGTHVAGIIASVAAGRSRPGVRILPITIADAEGTTTSGALVRGVRYAVARRAKIINISFGGRGFSPAEQNAINAAVRAGALVVVAVGNNGESGGPVEYPGAYRQVLAVGALNRAGRALSTSARGRQVALAAPGEDIARAAGRSAGGGVRERSGTSMAAAVVSGAAARIWARRPGLTAQQVRAVLENTATDVPPRGPDVATGVGAIDLRRALAARKPPKDDPEPNDDPALAARTPPLLAESGPSARTVRGRTGSWADPRDGFRVWLRTGETITARLRGPAAADLDLALWQPGTPGGERTAAFGRRWIAAASLGPDSNEMIRFRATRTGAYTLEVQGGRAPAAYTLRAARSRV